MIIYTNDRTYFAHPSLDDDPLTMNIDHDYHVDFILPVCQTSYRPIEMLLRRAPIACVLALARVPCRIAMTCQMPMLAYCPWGQTH